METLSEDEFFNDSSHRKYKQYKNKQCGAGNIMDVNDEDSNDNNMMDANDNNKTLLNPQNKQYNKSNDMEYVDIFDDEMDDAEQIMDDKLFNLETFALNAQNKSIVSMSNVNNNDYNYNINNVDNNNATTIGNGGSNTSINLNKKIAVNSDDIMNINDISSLSHTLSPNITRSRLRNNKSMARRDQLINSC